MFLYSYLLRRWPEVSQHNQNLGLGSSPVAEGVEVDLVYSWVFEFAGDAFSLLAKIVGVGADWCRGFKSYPMAPLVLKRLVNGQL